MELSTSRMPEDISRCERCLSQVRSSVCKRNRGLFLIPSDSVRQAKKRHLGSLGSAAKNVFTSKQRFSDSVCGKINENCARASLASGKIRSCRFEGIFRCEKRHENDISMQERTVGWEEDRYFRVIFKIIAIFLAVAATSWRPYDSSDTLLATVQLFKKSCKIVPLQYRASACGELKFSAEMCF